MPKCPYCREDIKEEAIVCKHCRKNIRKTETANNAPKKKIGKLHIILVILVGIILVLFSIVFFTAYQQMKSFPLEENSAENDFEKEEIKKGKNLIPFYDEKWMGGYKNKLTEEVEIKPQFSFVGQFSEGRAEIGIGKVVDGPGGARKYGFINPEGEIVIQPKFCGASSFSEGLASVRFCEIEKSGYIDKNGDLAFDPVFDNAIPFSEGLAAVELRDFGWGFISHEGSFIIEPYFGHIFSFSEGLACVSVGGKYGYINILGSFIINPQFESLGDTSSPSFKEGLAVFKVDKKYGYINKQGEIVIEPKFDHAFPFSEDLAMVRVGGSNSTKRKWGFIDQSGEFSIPPKFDLSLCQPVYFQNGVAKFIHKNKIIHIDKKGEIINELPADSL